MDRDNVFILTVNAGSSSLRLDLFQSRAGVLERVRSSHHDGDPGIQPLLAIGPIATVAHRVVHGGRFDRPVWLDRGVETEIERWSAAAPLHNPQALRWMRACREAFGAEIRQVAVFDTAFFAALPDVARGYALPADVSHEHEIRRYGFHGLAHQSMWQAWCRRHPGRSDGRIITLQLGAGCSIAAISGGRPIDTSMGFTPLEGLMMSTRSGDIDPGIVLYLCRVAGLDAAAIEDVLTRRSGLAGVGGDADMRVLLQSEQPRARLAVEMYCYRVRKYVGAYVAALGGADGIVFGGGVGEHAPPIRRLVLKDLKALGIVIDDNLNGETVGRPGVISADGSEIEIAVEPVDEARMMADAALGLMTENT